jgi:hypothetical protein
MLVVLLPGVYIRRDEPPPATATYDGQYLTRRTQLALWEHPVRLMMSPRDVQYGRWLQGNEAMNLSRIEPPAAPFPRGYRMHNLCMQHRAMWDAP